VLQEITVVGSELDDEIVRPELQASSDHLDVAPGVLDPRRRESREVRVLREDLSRTDKLGDLNQPAASAYTRMKWVEELPLVERLRRDDALAKR
jgi:hypothetical protein